MKPYYFLLCSALLLACSSLTAQITPGDPGNFVTIWQTDSAGTSNNDEIILLCVSGNTYDFDLYWEEVGNTTNNATLSNLGNQQTTTISFPSPGTYRVEIAGDFGRFVTVDEPKLMSIEQWGNIVWESFLASFDDCVNMSLNATDAPNLSNVTNMAQCFRRTNFSADLSGWDVSNVTDMGGLFYEATFNGNITNWDVSNVKTLGAMFRGNSDFNQDISGWSTDSLEVMAYMFYDATAFNQNVGNWDVSNVNNMREAFNGATSFNQDLDNWVMDSVETVYGLFANATSFNGDVTNWNLANTNDIGRMFQGATAFNQDISGWDVSHMNFFYQTFKDASSFDQYLGDWSFASSPITSIEFLDGAGLSVQNYDSTLIAWANNPANNSGFVVMDVDGLEYCDADSARQFLIDNYNWIFNGDSLVCSTVNTVEATALQAQIFPNPTTGPLQLQFEQVQAELTIQVYNSMGQILQQRQIQNQTFVELDFDLAPGLYFLSVENEAGQRRSFKLMLR